MTNCSSPKVRDHVLLLVLVHVHVHVHELWESRCRPGEQIEQHHHRPEL
jgi:hypothetical protein